MRVIKRRGLAVEVMDCNRLVVTRDRRVGIVWMVGTVGSLGGVTGVWFWDEGLGGVVSGEDVEKVGCVDRWGAGAGV